MQAQGVWVTPAGAPARALMVRAGVVKPSLEVQKSYTLQFVDKKVGVNLRPKN